jgi:hypothetical protein
MENEIEGPPLPTSSEKLRKKTPQQMVEMIQQVDKLLGLRKKQEELMLKLRRTLLLEWFGEEEKKKYIYTKQNGTFSWEMLQRLQLKKLWERLQDWAKKGVDRR